MLIYCVFWLGHLNSQFSTLSDENKNYIFSYKWLLQSACEVTWDTWAGLAFLEKNES